MLNTTQHGTISMYITTSNYSNAPSLVQRVQETLQPEHGVGSMSNMGSRSSVSSFQALHVEQQISYTKQQSYSFLEQAVSHCENCGDQRHTQTYRSISSSTHIEAAVQMRAVAMSAINYFKPTAYGITMQQNSIARGYAQQQQPLQLGFTYQQKLLEYLPASLGGSGKAEYHAFEPFLKPYRPTTPFIGAAEEVQQYIKDAFKATTGKALPDDIIIVIAPAEKIKAVHESLTTAQQWSDNIQGFSINGSERKIFVRQNDLDRVMLVVGHELGHVITAALGSQHDEEAKAFAFELAWMQAIVKNNIANLKENINVDCKPANNGLHNVAFAFVQQLVKQGREALEVYLALARGVIGKEKVEVV